MFAENLKKYRKLSGFRQDDIAKIIGLDRSAYAYYESGKTEPSIDNLKSNVKWLYKYGGVGGSGSGSSVSKLKASFSLCFSL